MFLFNMMFVFPLSGTYSAEVDRKCITYYAFLFRTEGGATEMTSRLAELDNVLQVKNSQTKKLYVSDYSFIL
jgi:hypothetical protein